MAAPASTNSPPRPSMAVTAAELAALLGGELVGSPAVRLTGVAALDRAGPADLSFIRSAAYGATWSNSRAGAAVVSRDVPVSGHDPATRALIVVPDADLAMVALLERFAPPPNRPPPGIHASAVIDPAAEVAPDARIGPMCVVGPGAVIEAAAVLHARVTLGAHARIGAAAELFPGVVVYDRCVIGARSILHANAVIGADGFGYRPDPAGRGLLKIPHAGIVRIGENVEIGACSCVDRAKFDATVIGDGTKIDNHVQIGHNVRVGRSCIICGMTGIAGSVTIEDGVTIAGGCGIADGLTIGARATIAAGSGVMHDVPAGAAWLGYPAQPVREQLRTWSAVRLLPDLLGPLKKILGSSIPRGRRNP